MTSEELDRVELQRRAKPRRDRELSAFEFQRWLERWKNEPGVTIRVALDGSHAIAVREQEAA